MSSRISDLLAAFGLLTRLPLPGTAGHRPGAAWAYPLVGAVIGALAGLLGMVAAGSGLALPLAALLVVAAQVMMTGAMHEDGLADMADGIWGGWDRAARLRIMRDSRIGSYGAIALMLGLMARVVALTLLLEMSAGWALAALIGAGAMSRAAMPALMLMTPPAREDGMARSVAGSRPEPALAAAAIAALLSLVLLGWSALPAIFWTALITFALGRLAMRKLGGHTGDVLGAGQQLSEIAILFSILA